MSSSAYSLDIIYAKGEDPTYYPGQTVRGHVEFNVTQALKLRGFSLLIKGSASCNYSKDCAAEQEFFVIERDLIEVASKMEPIEVAVGAYRYEFQHRLPRNIPYSVEGQYGNVRYLVQTTLDISWDLYDKIVCKPFNVQRYEDLSYMSGMREPREVQIQKQIDSSAWFFSRSSLGLVTIKAIIPKCGFAPGEKINIDVSVDNQTSADMENVLISLQYNENYQAQTPWAKLDERSSSKISETIAEGIKAGFTKKIKESVLVPENSKITSVMYSNVFQIAYHVQITAKFRRAGINLCIPVYIGTVALRPEDQCNDFISTGAPLWPPNEGEEEDEIKNGGELIKEADSTSIATVDVAVQE